MAEPGDIGGIEARLEKNIEIQKAQIEFNKALGNTNEALAEQLKLQEQLDVVESKRRVDLANLQTALNEGRDADAAAYREELQRSQDRIEKTRALTQAFEVGAKAASDMSKAIAGVGDAPNTALGKLVESSMKLGSFTTAAEKSFSGFVKGLKDSFSPLNVAVATADKVSEGFSAIALNMKKAMLEQSSLIASFNRATGTAGEFDAELQSLSVSLLSLGVSQQDTIDGFKALFSTVRSFSDLSEQTRKELAQTTSILSRMGFSASSQAQNIVFLTRSMSATETEAGKFNVMLSNLADNLNIPIDQLQAGFQSAMPVLGASARGTTDLAKQFGVLAQTMKATNLAAEKIVGIATKFDTFEGAADQVGLLNSVLGGPFLSTMQMVEALPMDRPIMIAQALRDSGKVFDQMGRYERQTIAAAAGLQDVNDLALLMADNFENMQPPLEMTDDIVERANKMKEFNSVMDNLNTILQATVVNLGPLFELVGNMASGIAHIVGGVAKIFSILPPELLAIGGAALAVAGIAGITGLGALTIGGGAAAFAALGLVGQAMGTTVVEDAAIPAGGPIVKTGRGQIAVGQPYDDVLIGERLTGLAATSAPAASRSMRTSTGPKAVNAEINLVLDGEVLARVVNNIPIDQDYGNALYGSVAHAIAGPEEIF